MRRDEAGGGGAEVTRRRERENTCDVPNSPFLSFLTCGRQAHPPPARAPVRKQLVQEDAGEDAQLGPEGEVGQDEGNLPRARRERPRREGRPRAAGGGRRGVPPGGLIGSPQHSYLSLCPHPKRQNGERERERLSAWARQRKKSVKTGNVNLAPSTSRLSIASPSLLPLSPLSFSPLSASLHNPATKLATSCLPPSVMMDSGWNWTPWMWGSATWRTAMMVPSSVQAVTSRSGGSVARSMTREW